MFNLKDTLIFLSPAAIYIAGVNILYDDDVGLYDGGGIFLNFLLLSAPLLMLVIGSFFQVIDKEHESLWEFVAQLGGGIITGGLVILIPYILLSNWIN